MKKDLKQLTVFQDVIVQKEKINSNNVGECEDCVIMNNSYNNIEASISDIYGILRGDKIKSEVFKAKNKNSFELKKGMQFDKAIERTPHQHWTIYYSELPNKKIVAFLKYTWSVDTFSKHFVLNAKKPINSAYDLEKLNLDITCHGGVKVFNGHIWEVKSKDKAVWKSRVTSRSMDKKTVQDYLNIYSKNIIVDSIKYEENNGGFHSFSNCTLYDLTINISFLKPKIETVSLSKIIKELNCNFHISKDKKIYLINENYIEPEIHILHLKDGLINKISSKYSYTGSEFMGKKISFKKEKQNEPSK